MNPTDYDSRQETNEHILRVRELLYIIQNNLETRGFAHDQSKLGPIEKPIFDKVTGRHEPTRRDRNALRLESRRRASL